MRWLALLACLCACSGDKRLRPRVYVAASFEEAAEHALGGAAIVVSAATSTHARRLEAGAKADVFVSANREWMDFLAAKKLLQPGTRRVLVHNRLVVVMPKGGKAWSSLSGFAGRVAMGDPEHVPAGQYGQRALARAGVWVTWKPAVVPTANVRQALALVERGEVEVGIVYRTDALLSDRVVVVHEFEDTDVVYEIARVRGGEASAYEILTSEVARDVFRNLGFRVN